MGSVTGGTIDLERRYRIADLEDLPEDGRRFELADGWLLVSPMARRRHQFGVPSLRVLELVGEDYVERAYAVGEQAVTVTLPFPVTLVPARLLEV